jgi:DNA-binding NarL/FixJ family response regulator
MAALEGVVDPFSLALGGRNDRQFGLSRQVSRSLGKLHDRRRESGMRQEDRESGMCQQGETSTFGCESAQSTAGPLINVSQRAASSYNPSEGSHASSRCREECKASEAITTGTEYSVLIVDDHELFSTSLAIALRSEGFDAEMLTVARLKDFFDHPITSTGLVVLDTHFGQDASGRHVDGADLTKTVRARGWMVLIVSCRDDSPGIAAAIAAGAIGYVPKSLSFERFLDTIILAAEGTPVMTSAERRMWLDSHQKRVAQERELTERLTRLSPREREVLQLLAEGKRAAAIAKHFVVSMPTIRTQIRSILTKLDVSCQLEAAALLRQLP